MEQPRQDIKPNIKLTPGNRRQKGRRSAPKAEDRKTGKENPIAYHYVDDRVGGFDVLSSSNGWWSEMVSGTRKIQALVDAYCLYMTDDEACSQAGITNAQLEYFQKLHSDFYGIKHAAKAQPDIAAKKAIVENVKTSVSTAMWWLERTQKDTFSTRTEQTGANGRDLFDGMTEKYKKLTEDMEKEYDKDKEHTNIADTGHTDAGPDGDGHEATPTEDTGEAEAVAT